MLKDCMRCQKQNAEHGRDKKRKDGAQAVCKECRRAEGRAGYLKNPEPYKQRAHRQRCTNRDELKKVMDNLRETGCKICGEQETCCLDFHHLFGKDMHVTRASGRGKTKFKEEVMKCVIVCANCHRKAHAGRINISASDLCSEIDLLQAGFISPLPPTYRRHGDDGLIYA